MHCKYSEIELKLNNTKSINPVICESYQIANPFLCVISRTTFGVSYPRGLSVRNIRKRGNRESYHLSYPSTFVNGLCMLICFRISKYHQGRGNDIVDTLTVLQGNPIAQ